MKDVVYKYGEAVTPSDSEDLSKPTPRAIYVGGTGDITVTLAAMADGEGITLKGISEGAILKIEAKRIWDTGTTATDIVALY